MRPATGERSLPRSLVLLFAVTCGLSVANIYYAQPLLDAIAGSLGISHSTVGIVVTVTQAGYGLGLILLVPLGDIVDRRRLIAIQLVLSVIALVVVGTAASGAVLLAGMAAVGALAVVTQVIVAFAASLAPPAERGSVVGTVTSGVVIGILLARTLAGVITDLAGWRAVYLTSAVITVVVGVLLLRVLPSHEQRRAPIRYGPLLRSVLTLYRSERTLRDRSMLALLTFAAFSVLWTPLVLPLSTPPLSLSHSAIGLFGLAGAAGALAAVHAGRLADRGLGQLTTGVALTLMLASWLPIGLIRHSLAALVIGLVLLDLAVQAVHVTSQSMIYPIAPDANSRLVGGYMVFYSIGTGAGSIASTVTYAWAGWTGVCILGAAINGGALLWWAARRPNVLPLGVPPSSPLATTEVCPAAAT
jgi:predicted MFS family arabinose efflux permease